MKPANGQTSYDFLDKVKAPPDVDPHLWGMIVATTRLASFAAVMANPSLAVQIRDQLQRALSVIHTRSSDPFYEGEAQVLSCAIHTINTVVSELTKKGMI